MKQSAELEQLLHWNESAEDFEKGEWARQQPWQQPWQTGYHLVLSCSLPPSRHYSCGSQVSLHFLLNRLCLPLSGGYLHNSNHSLSTVKFGHQHLTAQSQHTKWHGASVCHLEPEFLPFPHSANLQMRLQWQEGSPGVLMDLSPNSERDKQYSIKHMPITMAQSRPSMLASWKRVGEGCSRNDIETVMCKTDAVKLSESTNIDFNIL